MPRTQFTTRLLMIAALAWVGLNGLVLTAAMLFNQGQPGEVRDRYVVQSVVCANLMALVYVLAFLGSRPIRQRYREVGRRPPFLRILPINVVQLLILLWACSWVRRYCELFLQLPTICLLMVGSILLCQMFVLRFVHYFWPPVTAGLSEPE